MSRYLSICMLAALMLIPYFGKHCTKAQSATQCNTCLANGKACIDTQTYVDCDGGILSTQEHSCPTGKVCTANETPCATPTDEVKAICSSCNDCSLTDNIYVCMDEYHYGFCYGKTAVDQDSIRQCPADRYCSIGDSQICMPILDDSVPSCSTPLDNPPTTTTAEIPKLPTPDEFCQGKRKEGKFKAEIDTTCKFYIYCEEISTEFFGWLWQCAANEYFNTETADCEKQRPKDC